MKDVGADGSTDASLELLDLLQQTPAVGGFALVKGEGTQASEVRLFGAGTTAVAALIPKALSRERQRVDLSNCHSVFRDATAHPTWSAVIGWRGQAGLSRRVAAQVIRELLVLLSWRDQQARAMVRQRLRILSPAVPETHYALVGEKGRVTATTGLAQEFLRRANALTETGGMLRVASLGGLDWSDRTRSTTQLLCADSAPFAACKIKAVRVPLSLDLSPTRIGTLIEIKLLVEEVASAK
ncbi:hypothetical protein [Roseobacter weihaiensis]|uniref:hypothetical protein n=1 Tax=Roseobacter weihaiensis TaxID=2763262 RepID=UPI001D0B021F|nr:hypothetical protein [Roseobacter sp. H9]